MVQKHTPRRGVNKTDMKARNRSLVLRIVCGSRTRPSRASLGRRTGLSKMTVSNIIGELIADGLVAEIAAEDTACAGRPAMLLDVAPHSPLVVGVYLSRTAVTATVTDLRLRQISAYETPLCAETAQTLTDKLFASADRAVADVKQSGRALLGIGVSAIGPLDRAEGKLLRPPEFFGIADFPLTEPLSRRYGCPAILDNDMDAAALTERLYGDGRAYAHFLYLGITDGIGAGIVSDGRLYRDNSGFAGEVGHMSVKFDGMPCPCGNRGCLERYVRMPEILRRLQEQTGTVYAPRELSRAYNEGGKDVLDEVTDTLLVGAVNLVNLLDPDCLFIGHEGAYLPEACLQRLQSGLNARILAKGYKQLEVRRSSFGETAPQMGSAGILCAALFDRVISLPDTLPHPNASR